jgi:CcmD family protein
MKNKMRKFSITLILIINSFLIFAQDTNQTIEMADLMRSNGKIYIVVAVLATIFTGIIVYLINLDSKISKLEKRINQVK